MRLFMYMVVWFAIIALPIFYGITHAAEIDCYSGKTRIYHGYGNDFVFDPDFLGFTETKTHHLILITGDCIISAYLNNGEHLHAFNLREESKKPERVLRKRKARSESGKACQTSSRDCILASSQKTTQAKKEG